MHRVRQMEQWRFLRERIDQIVENAFRKRVVIRLAPPGGDQGTEDAHWLRRPRDICLIGVPTPRRRVVAPGRETESECDHGVPPGQR